MSGRHTADGEVDAGFDASAGASAEASAEASAGASAGAGAGAGASAEATPTLRVVAGNPTAEELAAVTAVLAGVEAERATESARRLTTTGESAWAESRRALRGRVTPGPGQWQRHRG